MCTYTYTYTCVSIVVVVVAVCVCGGSILAWTMLFTQGRKFASHSRHDLFKHLNDFAISIVHTAIEINCSQRGLALQTPQLCEIVIYIHVWVSMNTPALYRIITATFMYKNPYLTLKLECIAEYNIACYLVVITRKSNFVLIISMYIYIYTYLVLKCVISSMLPNICIRISHFI